MQHKDGGGVDRYKIEWNQSLSIGCELIDSQHKRLIELIGSIPESNTPDDERILIAAIEYAAEHFTAEEGFMQVMGYPTVAEHKKMHKKLTRIVWSYKRDYDAGKTDLYAFKQFMYGWVREHIMEEDRKIGAYIDASGDN